MEARFRRVQDGAYRWHLNRAAALSDAEGNLLGFVYNAPTLRIRNSPKRIYGGLLKQTG